MDVPICHVRSAFHQASSPQIRFVAEEPKDGGVTKRHLEVDYEDWCIEGQNGKLYLSWDMVVASLNGLVARGILPTPVDTVYISPRSSQQMPIVEESGFRTAVRDVRNAGHSTIVLTTTCPNLDRTPMFPAPVTLPVRQESTHYGSNLAAIMSDHAVASGVQSRVDNPERAQGDVGGVLSPKKSALQISTSATFKRQRAISTNSKASTTKKSRMVETEEPSAATGTQLPPQYDTEVFAASESMHARLVRVMQDMENQAIVECVRAFYQCVDIPENTSTRYDRRTANIGGTYIDLTSLLRCSPVILVDLEETWADSQLLYFLLCNEKIDPTISLTVSGEYVEQEHTDLPSRLISIHQVEGAHWIVYEVDLSATSSPIIVYNSAPAALSQQLPHAVVSSITREVQAFLQKRGVSFSARSIQLRACWTQRRDQDCGFLSLFTMAARIYHLPPNTPVPFAEEPREQGRELRILCARRLHGIFKGDTTATSSLYHVFQFNGPSYLLPAHNRLNSTPLPSSLVATSSKTSTSHSVDLVEPSQSSDGTLHRPIEIDDDDSRRQTVDTLYDDSDDEYDYSYSNGAELPLEDVDLDPALRARLEHVDQDALQQVTRLLPWITHDQLMGSNTISSEKQWGTAPGWSWYPYQWCFLVLAWNQERNIQGGGVLADECGAGKTRQGLGLFLLNLKHAANVKDVVSAWGRGDTSEHLPENACAHDRCPTAEEQPLACYCEPRNRRELYKKPGVDAGMTIIFTRASAIASFVSEVVKMLKNSRIMAEKAPPRIAVHDTSDGVNTPFMKSLTPDEISSCCAAVEWPDMLPGDWFQGPEATSKQARDQIGLPGSMASRTLIITTRGCFGGHVARRFCRTRLRRLRQKTVEEEKRVIVVSHVWIDEAHNEVEGMTMRTIMKYIHTDHIKCYGTNAKVWAATGTPGAQNVLNSLQFCFQYLHNDTWSTDDSLAELSGANLDMHRKLMETRTHNTKLLLALSTNQKSWTGDQRFLGHTVAKLEEAIKGKERTVTEFLARLTPIFQIRRDHQSRWFNGQPVIPIHSKHIFTRVDCRPNTRDTMQVQRIEAHVKEQRKLRHKALLYKWRNGCSPRGPKPDPPSVVTLESFYTARATANIPTVVRAWKNQLGCGDDESSDDESSDDERYDDDDDDSNGKASFVQDDPFLAPLIKFPLRKKNAQFWESVQVDKSAKAVKACEILDRIRDERRTHDGFATRSKVVVTTGNVVTLAAWKWLLQQRYGESTVYYTAGMKATERDSALEQFNTDKYRWIMLATQSSIAEGMNLQRAHHMIIVEPMYSISRFQQAFRRVYRSGQPEATCYTYLLVNTASEIELAMSVTLSRDGKFQEMILDAVVERQATAAREIVLLQ